MSIMPEHLVKRDGSVKPFDAAKITAAIAKAGKATGEFGEKRAQEMCETLQCALWRRENFENGPSGAFRTGRFGSATA